MEVHLQDNQVASTEAIQGTKDGVTYNLMTKEPNYVMKMMATSDNLVVDKSCHSSARQRINNGAEVVKEFQFKLPFDLHTVSILYMITTIYGMLCSVWMILELYCIES